MALEDKTRSDKEKSTTEEPVVLFDGVCNLCNGVVQFIIDHERTPKVRFAALQSEHAAQLLTDVFGDERANELRRGAANEGDPDSIVLVESGRGYSHSTAALRIARYLRAPYRWLFWLVVFPRPLRDVVYRFIARNRYRWFGKSETCRVPTPELRARFLA
jgi:predicted DCC family thiol-disulfide oxidoreductase YuxK